MVGPGESPHAHTCRTEICRGTPNRSWCPAIAAWRRSGVLPHTSPGQVCAADDSGGTAPRPTFGSADAATEATSKVRRFSAASDIDRYCQHDPHAWSGRTRDRGYGRDQLHQWPRPLRRLAFPRDRRCVRRCAGCAVRGDGARVRGHSGHRGLGGICGGLRRCGPGRGAVRLPRFRRVEWVTAPVGVGLTPAPGLPRGNRRGEAAARRGPRPHCAVGDFLFRRARRSCRRRRRARRGGGRVDARNRRCRGAGAAGPQRWWGSAGSRGRPRSTRCADGADSTSAAPGSDGRRARLDSDGRQARRGAGIRRGRGPELAQRGVRAHRAGVGVQPADPVRVAGILPAAGAGRHQRQPHPARRRAPRGRRGRCGRRVVRIPHRPPRRSCRPRIAARAGRSAGFPAPPSVADRVPQAAITTTD